VGGVFRGRGKSVAVSSFERSTASSAVHLDDDGTCRLGFHARSRDEQRRDIV
jgi:hypothetical protein